MRHQGLRFDAAVAPNGYAWWYLDALSDDGAHGITAIAFIGSVFSPYYAWARRRGEADPVNHCALNVALYGPRDERWTMTERGRAQVQQSASMLSIGPSHVSWNGSALEICIDEICAPVPRRMRGTIRLFPHALQQHSFALDAAGLHRWTPHSPIARVEVCMSEPSLEWSGIGYFDANDGDAPLEDSFEEWTWSRAALPDGAVITYDARPCGTAQPAASLRSVALQFGRDGGYEPIDVPAAAELPRTRWGLARSTRCEYNARVVRTLEDAPFYCRSHLDTCIMGMRAPAIHETLSLQRFKSKWVQCLLPFRMPRLTH